MIFAIVYSPLPANTLLLNRSIGNILVTYSFNMNYIAICYGIIIDEAITGSRKTIRRTYTPKKFKNQLFNIVSIARPTEQ